MSTEADLSSESSRIEELERENQRLRGETVWLRDARRDAVRLLAEALEAKDSVTRGHSNRVRKLCLEIARELGLRPEMCERLELGAFLHDLGKLGVDDAVLKKPGKLTPDEYSQMQEHPEIGMRMLEASPFFADVIPIVRHHHERWDGTGYPSGLAEEDIPLESRIIAICDTYDTMVSSRPYKLPLPSETALQTLRNMAGKLFDPQLVEIFIEHRVYERVSQDYSSETSF
jgi:putative nucleotidyltransferase with HDIG domain